MPKFPQQISFLSSVCAYVCDCVCELEYLCVFVGLQVPFHEVLSTLYFQFYFNFLIQWWGGAHTYMHMSTGI